MPRLIGPTQIWQFFAFAVAAILALAAMPSLAIALLDDAPSPFIRWLAALGGAGGIVVLAVFMRWSYRRSDEFERHQTLLHLAIGFAISVASTTVVELARYGGLLPPAPFVPAWQIALASWLAAVVVVRVASRREGRSVRDASVTSNAAASHGHRELR